MFECVKKPLLISLIISQGIVLSCVHDLSSEIPKQNSFHCFSGFSPGKHRIQIKKTIESKQNTFCAFNELKDIGDLGDTMHCSNAMHKSNAGESIFLLMIEDTFKDEFYFETFVQNYILPIAILLDDSITLNRALDFIGFEVAFQQQDFLPVDNSMVLCATDVSPPSVVEI